MFQINRSHTSANPALESVAEPVKGPLTNRPVHLIAQPSLETLAKDLATTYLHVEQSALASVSLETQQLDASARQAAMDEIRQTIDAYDKDHPHTGPSNVYLLDGAGIAGTDDQNEGPLRAIVSQVIRDPKHSVLALMPEDVSVKTVEDLSPASMLRALADTVLSQEGRVLVGKEALENYLCRPEQVPSTEHISRAATLPLLRNM